MTWFTSLNDVFVFSWVFTDITHYCPFIQCVLHSGVPIFAMCFSILPRFLYVSVTSLFESSHLFLHFKHAICHFYFILWLLDANHPETMNFSQLSNGLGFCRLGGGQTFRVALESPSRIIAASTQLWV